LQSLLTYDLGSQSWEQPSAFPSQDPAAFAAAGGSDNFYALLFPSGGVANPSPQGLAVLDTNAGTWGLGPNELSEPVGAYSESALASIGSVLYAVGGGGAGGERVPFLQAYDTTSTTWSKLTDMPSPRGWLAAANVSGELYAIDGVGQGNPDAGGFPSDEPLGLIEVYSPVNAVWRTFQTACQVGSGSGTSGTTSGGTTSGGSTSGGAPVDAGVCLGTYTQTGTVMPLQGGAFSPLVAGGYDSLLIRLEDDCELICKPPTSLNGSYQWLDLQLFAGSGPVVPGTYTITTSPPGQPGTSEGILPDGGIALVTLDYQEVQHAGIGQVNGALGQNGSVILTTLTAATAVGSYSAQIPEIDGGIVNVDGGVVEIQSGGTFAAPAASCQLVSGIGP
jgi:hypothetical protein